MGADFTMQKFPSFTMTSERETKFRETIDNISQEQYEELREDLFFDDEDENYIKQSLLDSVVEANGSAYGREVAPDTAYTPEGKEYEILVTGGMSWGDSPTETYDIFWRASYVEEIWDLAIDFSIEDVAKLKKEVGLNNV
tara:strand:+ start:948 stop:1367 length:420 start_codon:yes stop_codon:yes gene_type:complete